MNQYVEELGVRICEAQLEGDDVYAMVEVCSAIHARYSEFAEMLGPAVLVRIAYFLVSYFRCSSCSLSFKASFEQSDPSKLPADVSEVELNNMIKKRRSALRLIMELFVAGLIDDEAYLQRCISDLIKKDPLRSTGRTHNLLMLVSFARHGAGPILGFPPKGLEKAKWLFCFSFVSHCVLLF